jgi:hypothetical protein
MTLLSDFYRSYRKQRAIRSYARQLPRLLVRDYGFSRSYLAQQVRRTIDRSGLDVVYSCYAVPMFSNRDDFNQFHLEIGETCDYDGMRAEIADRHFHGDTDFTISDVFAASSEAGADQAHSGSHGMGGGDDHSGHSGHGGHNSH